jgi:hypothetical protein
VTGGLLRLVGTALEDQNDERAEGRRYFSSESMAKLTQPSTEEVRKYCWRRRARNMPTLLDPHGQIYTSSRDVTIGALRLVS